MLKKITLDNFKSWESLSLELKPVTGIFGPNSSGKSSILQFLLMLKQTQESVDRSVSLDFGSPTSYANLGSFYDAIFDHNDEEKLKWTIEWSLPRELKISNPLESSKTILFHGEKISLSASIKLRRNQPSTDYIKYTFADQEFHLVRKGETTEFLLKTFGENQGFKFIRKQGRVWNIPGPVKSYAFPDQAKTYHQNADFLSDLEFSYEKLINNIYYLGPLRKYPEREYTWSGARPLDVGPRGELVVDALLAAKGQDEKRSFGKKQKLYPFVEFIAQWLKKLNLLHDFKIKRIAKDSNLYKVEVRKDEVRKDQARTSQAKKDGSSVPVLITDVGFGVSQFLPVLVLLYYVPEGSTILLEQPEIHLHPAVQSGLADVILNAAKTRKIQVIVESHSEHLLRRLQRRVAEEGASSKDISLYFCKTKAGKSILTKLELDLFGSIDNWPEAFFGNEFDEISATQKAGLKRKISNHE